MRNYFLRYLQSKNTNERQTQVMMNVWDNPTQLKYMAPDTRDKAKKVFSSFIFWLMIEVEGEWGERKDLFEDIAS